MGGSGAPDFYYKEAQRLGYVARSAFKLIEIQKRHSVIKTGSSVLDLGCAPGAWLQVASQTLGPFHNGGSVLGIDLKKVKVPPLCDSRVRTISADVMTFPPNQLRALSPKGKGFSVILSDMCPSVSGITTKDAALSFELAMRAMHLALGRAASVCVDDGGHEVLQSDNDDPSSSCLDDGGVLRAGGNLVIKLLESEDAKEISQISKPLFRKSSWLRPKATRPSSREIYLICQGLKPDAKT